MSRDGGSPRDPVACEAVRPLLPDLAEGVLHEAGPLEIHLAACPRCSAELSRFRALIDGMAELREVAVEPRAGFVEQVLTQVVPETDRFRRIQRVASVASNPRVVLSFGGVVVGATAVGLLWWRAVRRGVAPAAETAASALVSS